MGLLGDFEHGVSKGISTVYSDLKAGVKYVAKEPYQLTEHLIDKGSSTIKSLGSSLSFPLLLVGIPIFILFLRR
jgi:hypothetical protein